jgi:hypothetical protein
MPVRPWLPGDDCDLASVWIDFDASDVLAGCTYSFHQTSDVAVFENVRFVGHLNLE